MENSLQPTDQLGYSYILSFQAHSDPQSHPALSLEASCVVWNFVSSRSSCTWHAQQPSPPKSWCQSEVSSSVTVVNEYSPPKNTNTNAKLIYIWGNISYWVAITFKGIPSHILLPTKTSVVAENLNDLDHFCNERKVDFTQLLFECWKSSETKMYEDHAQKGKMKASKNNNNIQLYT